MKNDKLSGLSIGELQEKLTILQNTKTINPFKKNRIKKEIVEIEERISSLKKQQSLEKINSTIVGFTKTLREFINRCLHSKALKPLLIILISIGLLTIYTTSSSNMNIFKRLIINNDQRRSELAELIKNPPNDSLYTPSTLNEYYKVLEDAKKVMDITIIDSETIEEVTARLKLASSNLVFKADKTELNKKLSYYTGFDTTPYTRSSVNSFNTSLNNAQSINSDENADQKKVDSIIKTLDEYFEKLELKGDITELEKLLFEFSSVDESEYLPITYSSFNQALEKAKAAVISDDMNQAEIDKVAVFLEQSFTSLEKKPDKTSLISTVDSFSKIEQGNYTENSWQEFQNNLNIARATIDNDNATAAEVNEALNSLSFSKKNLKNYTKGIYGISFNPELIVNYQEGYDFIEYFYINKSLVSEYESITYPFGSTITVSCTIIENDEIPDKGSGSVSIRLVDGNEASFKIYVKENRGKNTGKAAVFLVTVSVELIGKE